MHSNPSVTQSGPHSNPSMLIQMPSQQVQLQHLAQPQPTKPGTPHQITIQQQQAPQPFNVGNVQLQPVRTSNSNKYKYPERFEGQPATVTKQPTFEQQ